jgi:hypothetical protein
MCRVAGIALRDHYVVKRRDDELRVASCPFGGFCPSLDVRPGQFEHAAHREQAGTPVGGWRLDSVTAGEDEEPVTKPEGSGENDVLTARLFDRSTLTKDADRNLSLTAGQDNSVEPESWCQG